VNLGRLIRKHLEARFGKPSREASFVPPVGPTIEVLKWEKDASGEGVSIYATIGACEALVADERRCEFFVGLTPDVDDIAPALAEVALDGSGTGRVPNFGDTVTLAGPLWSQTQARTFLFASRGDQVIPNLQTAHGLIEFIQLVPLFANELKLKQKLGETGLWEHFKQTRVPYWDSRRVPGKL